MLAYSPPAIPLIIDHFDNRYQDLTAEDEKGILLALQHRDRVRRIRLLKPTPILQKLIIALDGEFPILEFLFIWHQRHHRPVNNNPITNLNLPETFRAPHLRRLTLKNFATPIESPQLTTMGNLVTLFLTKIPFSAYFHPNVLLQRLTHMPQLEVLWTGFNFGHEVDGQLLRTPIVTRVTLPNLHWLGFLGSSAYLEVLLPGLTAPLLKRVRICFFNRMIYPILHLRQFMSTARNLQVNTVKLQFKEDYLRVLAYPHMEAMLPNLDMELGGKHFHWQIVSAAQVFHAFSTVFSVVEHLTLDDFRYHMSSEWNNEADRIHWRKLLGPFGKVKNLSVVSRLVKQLSGALQPGEEESPTELLPELQELSYSESGASRNAFTQFVDARQKAGQPVTVVHI
jgi:hypothetical protein